MNVRNVAVVVVYNIPSYVVVKDLIDIGKFLRDSSFVFNGSSADHWSAILRFRLKLIDDDATSTQFFAAASSCLSYEK